MPKKQSAWQQSLTEIITDLDELVKFLNLTRRDLPTAIKDKNFPLRVPKEFVNRMEKGNSKDPLLLQILPVTAEQNIISGYSLDPLQEIKANPTPGILHKYHGRILVTLAGSCAINCRYCFRRHFPYGENIPSKKGWGGILSYLKNNHTIEEVILSGGEPLLIKDELLYDFIQSLAKISHLKRLRIHTRLPVVIPNRINEEFIEVLKCSTLEPIVVIHSNHPNELDITTTESLRLLKNRGITTLNQAVLLKHINDDADVLSTLSKKLFNAGVMPYYLHLLDKVQGAAHFAVSQKKAKQLIALLLEKLPGYLVPKLVQEVPEIKHKKILR